MNLLEDSVLVIRSTWLVNGDGPSLMVMVIWKQTTLHLTNANTGGLLSIWVTRPSLGGKGFFLLKDPFVDSLMKIPHFQLPHILSEPKLVELAAKLKRSPAQVVLRLLFPAVLAYL